MRRFIDEIILTDSYLAEDIARTLEKSSNSGVKYETELYEGCNRYDPLSNKDRERGEIRIKVFVVEDANNDQT